MTTSHQIVSSPLRARALRIRHTSALAAASILLSSLGAGCMNESRLVHAAPEPAAPASSFERAAAAGEEIEFLFAYSFGTGGTIAGESIYAIGGHLAGGMQWRFADGTVLATPFDSAMSANNTQPYYLDGTAEIFVPGARPGDRLFLLYRGETVRDDGRIAIDGVLFGSGAYERVRGVSQGWLSKNGVATGTVRLSLGGALPALPVRGTQERAAEGTAHELTLIMGYQLSNPFTILMPDTRAQAGLQIGAIQWRDAEDRAFHTYYSGAAAHRDAPYMRRATIDVAMDADAPAGAGHLYLIIEGSEETDAGEVWRAVVAGGTGAYAQAAGTFELIAAGGIASGHGTLYLPASGENG